MKNTLEQAIDFIKNGLTKEGIEIEFIDEQVEPFNGWKQVGVGCSTTGDIKTYEVLLESILEEVKNSKVIFAKLAPQDGTVKVKDNVCLRLWGKRIDLIMK